MTPTSSLSMMNSQSASRWGAPHQAGPPTSSGEGRGDSHRGGRGYNIADWWAIIIYYDVMIPLKYILSIKWYWHVIKQWIFPTSSIIIDIWLFVSPPSFYYMQLQVWIIKWGVILVRVVVVTTVGEMIGDTVVVVVANEPPPPSNMAGEEEKVGGIWRLEVDDVKK